jgi:hypothetical protein
MNISNYLEQNPSWNTVNESPSEAISLIWETCMSILTFTPDPHKTSH